MTGMLALTHMNGGVIEVFTCAECGDHCEQVPIHITGWTERFCCLVHARDWFHNQNVRRREHAH